MRPSVSRNPRRACRAARQRPDRDAVRDRREHVRIRRTGPALRFGDAVQEHVLPFGKQRLRRIPAARQVQRREHGRPVARQIRAVIEPVQMHDINRFPPQHIRDGLAYARMGRRPRAVVDGLARVGPADADMHAAYMRAIASDDDGAVAGLDERPIERRQDLFRAADRVRPDIREGVADAEDSEPVARRHRRLRSAWRGRARSGGSCARRNRRTPPAPSAAPCSAPMSPGPRA